MNHSEPKEPTAASAHVPTPLELATGMAGVGLGASHYTPLESPPNETTRSMQLRLRKQKSVASSAAGDAPLEKMVTRVGKRAQRPEMQEFRRNVARAARAAVGVLLAGVIQTGSSTSGDQHWTLVPSFYYLGGLAYAAVMVIYASAPTVGGVVQQIWQIDLGVAIALLFNFVVFACVHITQQNLISVSKNLNGSSYYVSLHDWGVVFPLIVAFTFVIFISPMQHNVKKFAVMSNAFFMLNFIDPMNPESDSEIKDLDVSRYATSGLMKNLAIYSVVGVVGTLISLATVLLPVPLFAIRKLLDHVEHAPQDIRKILNLIMDSYCFRAKDIKKMDFFRLRLDRLLDAAQHRLSDMEDLLDDCWWEELVGVGVWLRFNKTIAKQFVKLYARLLKDLRAMKFAIESETCHWTHVVLMKKMQQSFYVLQAETNDLLQEVSVHVLEASTTMPVPKFTHLDCALQKLMDKYTKLYGELLSAQVHTAEDVGKTMPLNVFVYSFHAFVHTLFLFEAQFNHKNFSSKYRVKNFLKFTWTSVYRRSTYPRQMVLFAVRTTLAVLIAYCASTFIFAFSSTGPTAIAMVAQFHVGGTYGNMMNRMTGLVAGTVVPSIMHFFVCKASSTALYNVLNNIVLFCWIVGSMYVCFSSPYLRMAGMVSAYMSASVLLDHSCRSTSTTTSLSYSSLTENSVAIIILMLVEASLKPQSARGLLRENVRQLLDRYGKVFHRIFEHHIASDAATAPSVGMLPTVIESGPSLNAERLSREEIESLHQGLAVSLPKILKNQKKLLHDATAEPSLWKPKFNSTQYSDIMEVCWTLLDRLRMLSDLMEWREKCRDDTSHNGTRLKRRAAGSIEDDIAEAVKQEKQQELQPSTKVADPADTTSPGLPDAPVPTPPLDANESPVVVKLKWDQSQTTFENVVNESFDTLVTLFGKQFSYRTPDDHAIFMQMKEAFRIADKDRNGTVDASELTVLLEKLMPYVGGQGNVHMEQYVEEFMQLVDKNHDGEISFTEFMQALNDGFRLELEIYENAPQIPVRLDEEPEDHRHPTLEQAFRPLMPAQETSSMDMSSDSAVIDVRDINAAVDETDPPTGSEAVSTAASSSHPHFLSASKLGSFIFGESSNRTLSKLGSSRRRRWAQARAESALLNVESFTLNEAAATLKQSYGELLLRALDDKNQEVTMEDFIVMSCVISACEDIAANLTRLNKLSAS